MNTLRIYIVGVGGQGNVLASKMIGEAALSMGVPVLMSETHGMAQRGGVVESTVVLGGAQSPPFPTTARTSCWPSSRWKPCAP